MKQITGWLALLAFIALLPKAGNAQCGTIHTVTYDTTVTGFGSADPGYNFTMPKFDPTLGTLVSVQMASVVTVQFSLTIENKEPSSKTTKVMVTREDIITGPTFADTVDYVSPATSYPLGPSDGVSGSGTDFKYVPPYYVLNQYPLFSRTLTNTADFMGTGSTTFNYKTDVGLALNGNYNVDYSGSATDKIKFSVTYTYCDNVLLASTITNFSASKKDGYIDIRWLTSNEVPNHSYEIQKSLDGINFTTITIVSSNPGVNQIGNYDYNYIPASNEKSKIYFRIKQVRDGVPEYSAVRTVDLGETIHNNITLKVLPNPVIGGSFSIALINNTESADWVIELFNIKGQVISKNLAVNTTLSKFPMREALSAGVYFVMVTNKRSNKKFVERVVVN